MKFAGEVTIPAPPRVVWDSLMDETVLIECVPGVEAIERISDTQFAAEGRAKIGPVDAVLKGELRLENVTPHESYTLIGQGKGAVGFVKARADVALHETDDGRATRLVWSVEAKLGGRLAQVGSRLLAGAAQKYADEFFARFSALVAERAGAGAEAAAPAAGSPAEAAPAPASGPAEAAAGEAGPRGAGLSPWIWVPALILVILALLYLWS
ncbi:MAG: hypothetical protein KatS3mg119_0041 [Rhodothalassiaceae bacterium]|nr:MAG: hypothetical protein KatS3mg119_0041 [Rhodothalassiaceae bacterium]